MKTSRKNLLFFLIALTGCGNKELSTHEAANIIKKEYPRIVDQDIYAGDPKYAIMLKDAGLDRDGYVTIKTTKKFGDRTGWISFMDKSKPYLLETPEQDKKDLIQKVRAATENLTSVLSIEQGEDANMATVTYETKFTEITPFGKLIKLSDKPQVLTAYFIHDQDGWHWQKRK